MAESEIDRLDPQPVEFTLSTGFTVDIVRLRTRQLFRLLRILTHGAGPAIMNSGLDFSAPGADFAGKLLAIIMMAIPDAEQEAIAFIQSMCKPADVVGGPGGKPESQLSKQERENDAALWDRFNEELFNPLPEDTLDLIEQIVTIEAPEFQALIKKVARLMEMARKVGDFGKPEKPPEAQELHLPEPSPPSSISSSTSTDGATSTSSTSPSAGSARQRKRPVAAGATSS